MCVKDDCQNIVFLLGAARSGTTMLGELLATHPSISYTGETNFVWRYGAEFQSSDCRVRATERERRYIRLWYQRFGFTEGKTIVLDKTPQNCLRVPFIMDVFPGARIIHIVRDGRAVALSAVTEAGGVGKKSLDSKAFRLADKKRQAWLLITRKIQLKRRVRDLRSLFGLLSDFPRAFRAYSRIIAPGRPRLWGPMVPGLLEMQKHWTPLEAAAWQWDMCCRCVESDGRWLGDARYIQVSYEKFVADPRRVLESIFGFIGVTASPETAAATRSVTPRAGEWRHGIREVELARLTSLLEPTLRHFGYLDYSHPQNSL